MAAEASMLISDDCACPQDKAMIAASAAPYTRKKTRPRFIVCSFRDFQGMSIGPPGSRGRRCRNKAGRFRRPQQPPRRWAAAARAPGLFGCVHELEGPV